MNFENYRLAFLVALLATPVAGTAATLDVFVDGGVIMAGVGASGPPEADFFSFRSGPLETSTANRTETAEAFGPFGSGTAAASFGVDTARGQLRLAVDAEVTAVPDGRGDASSLIQMELSESFFVRGTGRVTVGMELNANWNAQQYSLVACSSFNGSSGSGFFNNNCYSNNAGTLGPGLGSVVDQLIEISFDIASPDGEFVDFLWRLDGSVAINGGGSGLLSETAFLDASNTANIFFRTDGAVTAMPQTAGFLSNPAFGTPDSGVTPVPLPASAVLLIAGLGSLVAFRRRRELPYV